MLTANETPRGLLRYKYIAGVASLASALAWGGLYLLLGKFHGMWGMFNQEFPLFSARLLGVKKVALGEWSGLGFAMLDGAIIGGVLGLGLTFLLRRRPD